uniref:Uncharacterized protein n=1 Tax=Meloidogyne enterolobii TaxID=390850 RepID=A0A6V7UC65_MELEN|nr:unnamed protein product [Meloidogyne enterolobii]
MSTNITNSSNITLNINNSSSSTYLNDLPTILLILNIFELFIQFLVLFLSLINFRLILKISVIHFNLKLILLCQSFFIIQRAILRITTIIFRFSLNNFTWDDSEILHHSGLFCNYFLILIGHVIVLERLIATIFVCNYEVKKRKYFGIIWFLILSLSSAYNSYSDHSDQKITEDNPATLANLITYLIIILIAFIEILLAENIRTIKQLIPALIFYFINVLLTFGCQTFIYFNFFINEFNENIITQSLSIAVTLNLFIVEITIIIFHPYLNREVKLLIQKLKNKILFCSKNKIEDSTNNTKGTLTKNSVFFSKNLTNNQTNISFKSLNGKDLKAKQSIDSHFDMLRKAWNI